MTSSPKRAAIQRTGRAKGNGLFPMEASQFMAFGSGTARSAFSRIPGRIRIAAFPGTAWRIPRYWPRGVSTA